MTKYQNPKIGRNSNFQSCPSKIWEIWLDLWELHPDRKDRLVTSCKGGYSSLAELYPASHCDYSEYELVLDHPCQLNWHYIVERAAVPTGKLHSSLTHSCQHMLYHEVTQERILLLAGRRPG